MDKKTFYFKIIYLTAHCRSLKNSHSFTVSASNFDVVSIDWIRQKDLADLKPESWTLLSEQFQLSGLLIIGDLADLYVELQKKK